MRRLADLPKVDPKNGAYRGYLSYGMGSRTTEQSQMQIVRNEIDEAGIARLVRTFYERAREDALIGPIFNSVVADWEHHIGKITDFWSSIMLRTGRYDGRPMRPHLMLPLKGEHFDRWLMLFEKTAREIFSEDAAAIFMDRARRIADSFEMGIAQVQGGEIKPPRHMVR
jgi:hemoglobin